MKTTNYFLLVRKEKMITIEDKLIEPRDIQKLIRERRLRVGDRIRKTNLCGINPMVCHVDRRSAITLDPKYPHGNTNLSPTEIHKRSYDSDTDQIYAEAYRLGSKGYSESLKQLNELLSLSSGGNPR